MGRPARIFPADLIKAASKIAARLGPARATIAAIAKEAGAPVGSMYHRYPSRGALLVRRRRTDGSHTGSARWHIQLYTAGRVRRARRPSIAR